jgi:hypothetical protein
MGGSNLLGTDCTVIAFCLHSQQLWFVLYTPHFYAESSLLQHKMGDSYLRTELIALSIIKDSVGDTMN